MATTDSLNIVISAETGNAAQNISNTANELTRLDESAKTADTDMSALVKAMSDAAQNMVAISGNIAASASGMAGFQNSFDSLSAVLQNVSVNFESLNTSIQGTAFGDAAAKVTELSDASRASADALRGITDATDGFGTRMGELRDATGGTADGMSRLQSEMSEALASIRNFSGSMSTAGSDAETASKKIKELTDDLNRIRQSSEVGKSSVLSLAAGFKTLKGVVATLGIGAFIKNSNDAYNVQMQNELKLTSHMKHRMNATEEQIQAVKDLASAQQKLGIIGDEIQLAGAQQLTTYARQTSTLQTLMPAMNNLIAQNAGYEASVGDAASAADMLGRALNGQYTSLKRMGVSFTAAQENVLKYGTEEQKAAVLADAINSKVGNMNQLLAQTPTGQMKQLQNELGDFQEELGATWQPLITAFLPIMHGSLEMLAEPVKNVSRGITTIGQAIASIDSPAVRAIALAAAGIAVMNKLKFAVGGTAAGIILAGVLLAGLIGSMQEEQESIGDIVSGAYNAAADATNQAADAASDYKDELGEVQKAAARLAGFDTITKLSGGNSGSLVNALIGDNGLEQMYAFKEAAAEAANAWDFETPTFNTPDLNWIETLKSAFNQIFGTDEEFWNNWEIGATVFKNNWTSFWGNWKIGWETFKRGWGEFWDNWRIGLEALQRGIDHLYSEDFVKDVGNVMKNTPLAEVPQLKNQIILMSEYGVRSSEELMQKDFSAYNDYMEKYLGFPKVGSEQDFINLKTISAPDVSALKYVQDNNAQYETPTLEISQTDRYDVPTRPSGVPSNVPTDQIAPVIHVYINDEEAKAEAITVNNGK